MKCEGCKHLCYIGMTQRGVMDCDPPEWYCDLDYNEDEDCNMFDEVVMEDPYEEEIKYHDWQLKQAEAREDR